MNSPAVAGTRDLRHAGTRYPAARDMMASILQFVKAGVDAGEAVLIASAGPVLQRLRIQLGGHGEHVTWTGMASATTNPRRITAVVRAFADEHPGQPIRIIQEPAWHVLSPAHLREAIRHEALLNLALAGTGASVLCAYDGQLDAARTAAAEHVHPMMLRNGEWQASPAFTGHPMIPPACDEPLPEPPGSAAVITYRGDQGTVRQFVAERARLAGLAADRVTDLVIAVGELAANTLAHTSGPGTLAMWHAGDELLCQVHDSGHIRDPLAGTHLPDPAAPGGGRGLWVVHQLCDLAEIRTGPAGTTIRLHLQLARPRTASRRRRRAASECTSAD